MSHPDARLAVLEEKVETLEEVFKEHATTTKRIAKDLDEIVVTIKVLKWVFGVALAAGPSLGVIISKLF